MGINQYLFALCHTHSMTYYTVLYYSNVVLEYSESSVLDYRTTAQMHNAYCSTPESGL